MEEAGKGNVYVAMQDGCFFGGNIKRDYSFYRLFFPPFPLRICFENT